MSAKPWCADNALDELQELSGEDGYGCLCPRMSTEVVETVDDPYDTGTEDAE